MGGDDYTMRHLALILLSIVLWVAPAHAERRLLRVCADPNNMPFSNEAGEGLENKLIDLVASEMHADVEYVWWAQRRGFTRNTLNARTCDVWPGIATAVERVATTRPYYRSSYVFVTRADRDLDIQSFDDPRLQELTIGVQLIGDDGANPPPAHALARRGLVDNVRGYMLYGDYTKPNPPAAIIDAVRDEDVDVAVVWGPLAGYFAGQSKEKLRLAPVQPWLDGPRWPMVFDISMGVRKEDNNLRRELDDILRKRADEISELLAMFHVPVLNE